MLEDYIDAGQRLPDWPSPAAMALRSALGGLQAALFLRGGLSRVKRQARKVAAVEHQPGAQQRASSAFSSLLTIATGIPPRGCVIWMAKQPRPPAPPQIRTVSPGSTRARSSIR